MIRADDFFHNLRVGRDDDQDCWGCDATTTEVHWEAPMSPETPNLRVRVSLCAQCMDRFTARDEAAVRRIIEGIRQRASAAAYGLMAGTEGRRAQLN